MKRTSTLVLIAALSLFACKRASGPAAPPAPGSPEAEAREIFATRCTPCHGASGMGDGVASAALNLRPRNFHDSSWQSAATDQGIEHIIQVGGAAVGKSGAMPPNPDLVSKPAVVAALRAYIRSFGN